MLSLVLISGLLAFAVSKPCETKGSQSELLLSLNKCLLRSLEAQDGFPNPSVHLALRLSNIHNLAKESEHLNHLKTNLHNSIQSALSGNQAVAGRLALYTLALKSSCYDVNTITFTIRGRTETLLMHLKRQMEQEKENIALAQRPLTNYYQYSLGVLTLCVSGIGVNKHVSNKLIKAVQHKVLSHGDTLSVDTYAMAGMALKCVNDSGTHVDNANELASALNTVKQELWKSRRTDGHIGNEFSTGLAVQALLAMGSTVEECAPAMEAMSRYARCHGDASNCHNPMGISQNLPALYQKSYLSIKGMECLNEDDSLVLEPEQPVELEQNQNKPKVRVEVNVKGSRESPPPYIVQVPKGSTLLEALELLKQENNGFTFNKESSLWGPYLSMVNGEQARMSDRRYWHLSSNGIALSEGIGDFRIEMAQTITIENKPY